MTTLKDAVVEAAMLWRAVVEVDNAGGGDYVRTLGEGHAADAKRLRLAAAVDAYRAQLGDEE